MTDIAIEVDAVSKRFRLYHDRNQSLKAAVMRGRRARFEEFWALRDVSLEVPAGSTFGLIGQNGSGKSTLLKCMARILRPDHGEITTMGKVSALLELGAGFHPELSGRDNVYLNGAILGLSSKEIDRRFDDIVGFAGLERFIDSPVKNYSSGMYVRLGFSVAINVEPDVLLVDEVLAVGDEQFQRRCAEKFSELRRSGRTIVIVSHALGSMESMCDSVAWLDQGSLREVGRASDVVDEYLRSVGSDPAQAGGARWGDGPVRIERLDVEGQVDGSISTGDAVTLRLHYQSAEEVARPVFSVSVQSLDGTVISHPSTHDVADAPVSLSRAGTVDLHFDRLMLLPGAYNVGYTVTDATGLHVHDARHKAVQLLVRPGHPHESHGGLVALGGSWRFGEQDREPGR